MAGRFLKMEKIKGQGQECMRVSTCVHLVLRGMRLSPVTKAKNKDKNWDSFPFLYYILYLYWMDTRN